jgi:hypothetical protein
MKKCSTLVLSDCVARYDLLRRLKCGIFREKRPPSRRILDNLKKSGNYDDTDVFGST